MSEALIAAAAVVLAALIALYGTLSGRRLNRIDQRLDRVDQRLDRFEDHLERQDDHLERQDGSFLAIRQGIGSDIAAVGARIDRLYDLMVAERRGLAPGAEAPEPEPERPLRRR